VCVCACACVCARACALVCVCVWRHGGSGERWVAQAQAVLVVTAGGQLLFRDYGLCMPPQPHARGCTCTHPRSTHTHTHLCACACEGTWPCALLLVDDLAQLRQPPGSTLGTNYYARADGRATGWSSSTRLASKAVPGLCSASEPFLRSGMSCQNLAESVRAGHSASMQAALVYSGAILRA
jgi:hypothetical protein